jgi:predicted ATPase/predicted Ser/Thr protein kinase
MIGQTLGRYCILEEIGSGGMGVVYRARDERLERDVALKVLPRDRLGDETARKRFRKEAKALSALNHPNIATVYDVDAEKGMDFLVMEYITGETLEDILLRGALEESEVIRLSLQLAEGLAAAHNQGVIHRDLKPGNLRVTSEGRLKILDFGLALLLRSVSDTATTDSRITGSGAVVGTLPYMAPEQIRGELADERTDIYAAGAVFYEMATGCRLFPDKQGAHLISAILTQWPAAPREVKRDISPALEKIILKALDKQRDHRYPSAKELREELESLGSGVVTAAVSLPFLEREKELARVERPVFVARKEELARLGAFLDHSLTGQGRVVFVTGEAGKGKTALVNEFVRCSQEVHGELIVANGNCNAHTGIGDPYLPFREVLALLTGEVESRYRAGAISSDHATRLWHSLPVLIQSLVESGPDLIDTFVPGRALLERAESYAAGEWLEKLRDIVERKASMPADPSLQQSLLFVQYTRVLEALAQWKPVILVLDDLQWADVGSINLLLHIAQRIESSRLLVIGTYRSDEVALGRDGEIHPLKPAVNECKSKFGDIDVEVGRTGDREFVDAYLDTEPNRFGSGFREAFYRHTEGHSLFMVEMFRGLKDQGALKRDGEGRWLEGDVDWEKLPIRVEASIGARIDRMPEHLKEVLTLASVEGEFFTGEVLAGVQKADDKEMVRLLSGELDKRHQFVSAQGIRREGGRRLSQYRFRHILFQKYLYNSLDDVERAHLHEDAGNVLETMYGEQTEGIAVKLARHFQEAGIAEKAVKYLQQAGNNALQKSANAEAIVHFKKALELLNKFPASPERTGQELALQLPLAVAMMSLRGYTDTKVGEAFTRAHELCKQIGETPQIVLALYGLWAFYCVRSEYEPATQLAEQILRLAPKTDDPILFLPLAHNNRAFTYGPMGEFQQALKHAEKALSFYDPQKHRSLVFLVGQDIKSSITLWIAVSLWLLGYPDQGRRRMQDGLTYARELAHPLTLSFALYFSTFFHKLCRDVQAVQEAASEEARLSAEYATKTFLGSMLINQGWVLAEQGRPKEAIAQIRQGLMTQQAIGMSIYMPFYLGMLAEAYLKAGQIEEGLAALEEGIAFVERTGERFYEAGLHHLKGELLLEQGVSDDEVEKNYQKAIQVARKQSAKSLELRATMSLARLWQKRGKKEEARQRLSEIYEWFTEGFDTPDLVDAKALLEELSS